MIPKTSLCSVVLHNESHALLMSRHLIFSGEVIRRWSLEELIVWLDTPASAQVWEVERTNLPTLALAVCNALCRDLPAEKISLMSGGLVLGWRGLCLRCLLRRSKLALRPSQSNLKRSCAMVDEGSNSGLIGESEASTLT